MVDLQNECVVGSLKALLLGLKERVKIGKITPISATWGSWSSVVMRFSSLKIGLHHDLGKGATRCTSLLLVHPAILCNSKNTLLLSSSFLSCFFFQFELRIHSFFISSWFFIVVRGVRCHFDRGERPTEVRRWWLRWLVRLLTEIRRRYTVNFCLFA